MKTNNMEIVNKIVIITGGLGGIAIAVAKKLLQEGAKYVALFDISKTGKVIDHGLDAEFGKERIGFYTCDVRKRAEFEDKYDEVVKTHGRVDVLINSAGIFNDNEPELEIDVNFKGTVFCTLTAIDRMRRNSNENGGTIVNISSVAGLGFPQKCPVYAGTKHAVIGFTCSLKNYYEENCIRTMVLCPGLTSTPLLKNDTARAFLNELNLDSIPQQSPENVGFAILKVIKEGESGSVWIVEKNEPPYAAKSVGTLSEKNKFFVTRGLLLTSK